MTEKLDLVYVHKNTCSGGGEDERFNRTVSTRADVAASLKGQILELPDFSTIYGGWPVAVSPHLDWLRLQVSARLRSLVMRIEGLPDRKYALRRLEAADFGFFVATWWPNLNRDQLQVMAFFIIWLFLWDDEIDSECSNLGNEFDTAQSYRQKTLEFIASNLGLASTPSAACTSVLITSISDVTVSIAGSEERMRRRFFQEMEYFVHATEIEQKRRLKNQLPQLEEYIDCRMGTSGVGVCVMLHNILVEEPMDCSSRLEMDEMMHQINVMISITNDILSLKKELAAGTPDSIIPILWQQSGNLQEAVNKACEMLKEARSLFDESECRMFSDLLDLPLSSKKRYAEMCKTNCTGNVNWSILTGRYGISGIVDGKTRYVKL